MAWEYWSRAPEAIDALRQQGYRIVGLEKTDASVEIEQLLETSPVEGSIAFVVGHEINGLSDAVLECCDEIAHLPMLGHKDSLNVAVAFGLAAYTLRRHLGRTTHS